MTARQTRLPQRSERLRASPTFALAFSMDGRPYVAGEVEPYTQYWLSERDRVLHSLFAGRRGETVGGAVDGYLRLTGAEATDVRRRRLLTAIADMRAAGILAGEADDTSRYDAGMAADYLRHRPFPSPVADLIVDAAGVTRETRVLDLAGGPGSLALELARTSDAVSMMELSRGFVAAARGEAQTRGLRLTTIHDSCNRLVTHDGSYDLITVSQALHWLDDVAVCRGVCRSLRDGGSFFVVLGAMELQDDHPLSFVLGDHTPLGDKSALPFEAQARALQRRLALLFDALDAPDVQRIDPAQTWRAPGCASTWRIRPAGIAHFQQRRPMGAGFARAFLSPQHVAMTGQAPGVFWAEVEARCAAASPAQRQGRQDWALLQFRRGGPRDGRGIDTAAPVPIDWTAAAGD